MTEKTAYIKNLLKETSSSITNLRKRLEGLTIEEILEFRDPKSNVRFNKFMYRCRGKQIGILIVNDTFGLIINRETGPINYNEKIQKLTTLKINGCPMAFAHIVDMKDVGSSEYDLDNIKKELKRLKQIEPQITTICANSMSEFKKFKDLAFKFKNIQDGPFYKV